MLDFGFWNMDCMKGMKEFPDNYFDLAVVDPPYGGGLTDNGGCQGWFSKYHQQDPAKDIGGGARFGGRFDKYKQMGGGVTSSTDYEKTAPTTRSASRTQNAKKSYRGILRRGKNISRNCSVSHAIRSYGAGIIFHYRRQGVF